MFSAMYFVAFWFNNNWLIKLIKFMNDNHLFVYTAGRVID